MSKLPEVVVMRYGLVARILRDPEARARLRERARSKLQPGRLDPAYEAWLAEQKGRGGQP